MSLPEDEVAERGRSIFERLRAAETEKAGPSAHGHGEPPSASDTSPGDALADDDSPSYAPASGDDVSSPGTASSLLPDNDGEPSRSSAAVDSSSRSEVRSPDALRIPLVDAPGAAVADEDPTDAPAPDDGEPAARTSVEGGDAPGGEDRMWAPSPTRHGPEPGRAEWENPTDPVVADEGRPAGETSVVVESEPFVGSARYDEARPGDETVTSPPGDEAAAKPDMPIPQARPIPELPRVFAVANQKGGVGKTTTTVNLGASLADLGYRVLVVDLDPQGNATTGLGINSRNLEHSLYDVLLHDVPLEDCIEPTSLRNLFVAPATIDLAGAEIELVPVFSRELRLRRAIEEVRDDFDYVLVDCPPSLGLLTVNGLAAATEVLVPIQCEYYALEGLGQLLRNVNLVQSNLNPALDVSTIVLTMFDARTKLAEQVADEVRKHFGPKVCRMVIPRTVRLSEAPSFGQPIIVFDPTSRGAIAYRELAKEVSGGAPQRTR